MIDAHARHLTAGQCRCEIHAAKNAGGVRPLKKPNSLRLFCVFWPRFYVFLYKGIFLSTSNPNSQSWLFVAPRRHQTGGECNHPGGKYARNKGQQAKRNQAAEDRTPPLTPPEYL